jgi:hypothetical protein
VADSVDDLSELEQFARDALDRVSASEQRRLLRAIGATIQSSQRARIASQQAPDGSAYPKRKTKEAPSPGKFALRFLYPKGGAEPRTAFLKSWVHQGPIFTGYDIEAGAIRSFYWDKVDKFLPIPAADQNRNAGKMPRRGRIRARAMFRKLKGPRFLQKGVAGSEAWIGFSGRAGEVARVHQEGLEDKPSQKAKMVRYIRRQLLGLTPVERDRVMSLLIAQATVPGGR